MIFDLFERSVFLLKIGFSDVSMNLRFTQALAIL